MAEFAFAESFRNKSGGFDGTKRCIPKNDPFVKSGHLLQIPALLMSGRRPSKKKTMYASFSYSRNLPLMFVQNAHP
ncbi:hypothetical protein B4135_2188 [Caldibacillus debilis]|uniref:Uncharacterized protein n=1 Tax=Caldibacillus debilis TaxID=301148 RepID=A0A150M3T6_9BACI|nr:hypothetical protein B4135_2188 [Caldibacillus debilis]